MSVVSAISLSRRPSAAFAAVGLFWGTFAAYVPVIKARLGVDDAVFGLLLLGSAVGLVTAMWLAPRADRFFGARGMQVAAALFAGAVLLPGMATVGMAFALAMVAVGMASGLLDVIMNARVADLEARHSRALMNANHGMFSLAYGLSALLSGAFREAGWPPEQAFAALAMGIVALALILRMDRDTLSEEEASHTGAFPFWPVFLCGAVVFVAFTSEATVEAWSALHVERTLGGGAAEGALGPATLGLTMAVGRFGGQALSERFSELTVIVVAALMAATGAVIVAGAPTPVVAYAGFGVLGLGVSVIGPVGLALAGKAVAARHRTDAIARAAVMGFSGFFVAPVLMGTLSQLFGLRVAFGSVAILLLMAIPLALAVGRRGKGAVG